MANGVLDTLIDACRRAAAAPDPLAGVRAALAPLAADPRAALAELPAFEGEDHPLLCEDAVSVFLVRQTSNTAGPPHDHGMSAAIVMLDGVEIHRHYRRDGDSVALDHEVTLGAGEILTLAPTDVHAIANPDATPSLGVHVYLGDLVGGSRTLWDPRTGEAMAFTTEAYDRMVTTHA